MLGVRTYKSKKLRNTSGLNLRLLKSKKAYFYVVEIILVLLLVVLILSLFPISQQVYPAQHVYERNLKELAFSTLRNLDELGLLQTFFNSNFTQSNFTALQLYIQKSLFDEIDFELEYALNDSCFFSNGTIKDCSTALSLPKKVSVVSACYTASKRPEPVTITLYLWRLL